MADFLGTLTNLGSTGGDAGGSSGGGAGGTGGSSSGFDLSKVLNVDNSTSFEKTTYSDHQSNSQDASVVDNGSDSSQSFESSGGSGENGSSSESFASSDQDFGGSQSDSSEASHNVDYTSHSFTNDFSLDATLDQLSQSQHSDGGGLLGLG